MQKRKELLIASLVWQWPPGQLHTLQGEVLKQLGYSHEFFQLGSPIPPQTDAIFVQGPYGSLLPLIKQLKEMPSSSRPILVYWFQQSFDLVPYQRVRRLVSPLFSELDRHFHSGGWARRNLSRVMSRVVAGKGARLGFLGDLLWLHRQGLLDVLALSSSYYSTLLAEYGISSIVVPRGYHPDYGEILNNERDIAVVWMGKLRTKRRREAVYWLREQLEKRGLTMHIYDGVENPFIFGDARMEVLNRTWFVPNIFFSDPTNELSIRFYFAAANGAAVITEPSPHQYRFVPGQHLVVSSIEEMPDEIVHYIEHEEEWRLISESMLSHMQTNLRLETSIATIMEQAERVLQQIRQ
ncbi:MAG: glycosyltransferase family 1 protein [Anaerolineaceae bacterium]|nr:glycosyltransferase family 1 protein [Anaerolineaceae bacterium]